MNSDSMRSGSGKLMSLPRLSLASYSRSSRRFMPSAKVAVTDSTIHEQEEHEADQDSIHDTQTDNKITTDEINIDNNIEINTKQHALYENNTQRDTPSPFSTQLYTQDSNINRVESFHMGATTYTPPGLEEKSNMGHSISFGALSQENSTIDGKTIKINDERNIDEQPFTSARFTSEKAASTVTTEDSVGFSARPRRLRPIEQMGEKVPSFNTTRTRALSYRTSNSPKNGNKSSGAGASNVWEEEESAIADVFFLSWPELYLEAVQSLIMIIALYFALYFTNFIVAAESPQWRGLTLIPAIASSLLLIYIVKSAVILSALHAVDCDAILEVLEQTEGARLLSEQIKQKITGRLQEMGTEPQSEIFNLFEQIDDDGNGYIK